MLGRRSRMAALLALVLVLVLSGPGSQAQSRSQVRLSGVGHIASPGRNAASRYFNAYSYGVGGLAKPAPSRRESVLASSIGGRASYSVCGRTGRAARPRAGGVRQTAGVRLKKPVAERIGRADGVGLTQALGSKRSTAVGAAAAYMSSFQSSTEIPLGAIDKPITSLAPGDDSLYSELISKGEKAFEEGNFEQAYREFRMANHIGIKDPESLLGLAHATFAKSTYSYAEASFHLRSVLKYFPELPLAPLSPKVFFGDTPKGIGRYTSRIVRLEDHIAGNPQDMGARLLLIYFRWFEGQSDKAMGILTQSAQLAKKAKDTQATEAFDIFLDAVEAGRQLAAERPTTQPAESSE